MFIYRNGLLQFVQRGLCSVAGDDPAPAGGDPAAVVPAVTLLNGDEGEIDPAAPAAVTPPAWRADWREVFAGGDEKALNRFKRFTSPENVARALLQTQDRLRSGASASPLPDDATPEEIATYRKTAGIPDTAEGYGIAFPADMKPTEDDTSMLVAFQEDMLGANVSPAAAKAAFNSYMKITAGLAAQRAEAWERAEAENRIELRAAFPGHELSRNSRLAKEELQKHFPPQSAEAAALEEVLTLRMPNGVRVGDYAPFARGFFAMARAYASEEAVIGGDGAGGGKSIDDEYNGLLQKEVTGKLTASEDARMNQLKAAQLARNARGRAA